MAGSDLTFGVNPGIGSSGGVNDYRGTFDFTGGLRYSELNRRLLALHLPSLVIFAIVGKCDFIIHTTGKNSLQFRGGTAVGGFNLSHKNMIFVEPFL